MRKAGSTCSWVHHGFSTCETEGRLSISPLFSITTDFLRLKRLLQEEENAQGALDLSIPAPYTHPVSNSFAQVPQTDAYRCLAPTPAPEAYLRGALGSQKHFYCGIGEAPMGALLRNPGASSWGRQDAARPAPRPRQQPRAPPRQQPQGPPPSAAASRQRPPPAARDPRRGAGRAGRRAREGGRARDARPRARDADAAPPLPPRRAVAEGRPLPRSAAPGGAELGAERPGPAGPDGGGRAGAAPRGAG